MLVSIALASIGASRGLGLRDQIYHSFLTQLFGACQEPDHKGNLYRHSQTESATSDPDLLFHNTGMASAGPSDLAPTSIALE